MRNVKVAAAQLGPIQQADSRQAVVARMIDLMRQAEGCDLIVYPELALTTFSPAGTAKTAAMPTFGSSAKCRMPPPGRCSRRRSAPP